MAGLVAEEEEKEQKRIRKDQEKNRKKNDRWRRHLAKEKR
jgi:hypothetical protein